MSNLSEKLFYDSLPPKAAGVQKVRNAVTGAAAASFDWAGSDADTPKGKCWIEVQPLTTDLYVTFGSTATTATTTTTGHRLAAGQVAYFYVDPVLDRYIDHISTGAGTVKVRVVSNIGERRDI